MKRWVIEPDGQDFAVLRDGRQVCLRSTEQEARRYVKTRKDPGDIAMFREPDGYLRKIRNLS